MSEKVNFQPCIGPLMFIIYINDLPNVLEHSNCLMYAVDTVVYGGDYCS